MRDSNAYIITLGDCINVIASHTTQEWYEVMDIKIDGLREAFARAEANAENDENEDFAEPMEIEAQYIKAHQHDLYLVKKPSGYGPTQYIRSQDRVYRIAFMKTDGSWDIVREFISLDDSTANEYADEHYGDQDWFVLDANGRNINGGAA